MRFWQRVLSGFAEIKKNEVGRKKKQNNEAICKINDVDHMLEGSVCVCVYNNELIHYLGAHILMSDEELSDPCCT